MKKIGLFCALFSTVAPLGLALSATINQPDIVKLEAKVFEYGIYKMSEPPPNQWMKRTKNIPAKTGIEFGVMFSLIGEPKGKSVALDAVWRFPESGITNPETGKTLHKEEVEAVGKVGDGMFQIYRLSKPWEVVKGDWYVDLYYEGRKIGSEKFVLVDPDTDAKDDRITLDLYYQPNRELRIIDSSTTEILTNITGNKNLIDANKKKGITFPHKMTLSKTVKSRSKTGPLEPSGEFSIEISIEDVASFTEDQNGMRINMPNPLKFLVGLKVLGKIRNDHEFVFETVEGRDLRTDEQVMLKTAITTLIAPKEDTAKSLTLGDIYYERIVTLVPVLGSTPISLNVDSRYILTAKKNRKAYFDVSSRIYAPGNNENFSVSAAGGVIGKMIYGIENKVQEKHSTNMGLNMEIKKGDTLITSSMKAVSTIQKTLIKNDN